jgi:hypothetical protein
MWFARWLYDFVQDTRYGIRGLRRHPALAAGVVVTLAVGIGVNTAIFSVLNGWLFRPLPVPNPRQIMVLAPVEEGRRDALESYLNYTDLRERAADCFSGIFAFAFRITGLNVNGETRQFVAGAVSGNYFSVLGVGPALGRVFVPGDINNPLGISEFRHLEKLPEELKERYRRLRRSRPSWQHPQKKSEGQSGFYACDRRERCSPLSTLPDSPSGRGTGVIALRVAPAGRSNRLFPRASSLFAHPRRQGQAATRCAVGAALTAVVSTCLKLAVSRHVVKS